MTTTLRPTLDEYPYHATEDEMREIDLAGIRGFQAKNYRIEYVNPDDVNLHRLRLMGFPRTTRNLEIIFEELLREGKVIISPVAPEPKPTRGVQRPTAEEESLLVEEAKALQAQRNAEQAALRNLSPIPGKKFNGTSRAVAPVSPELERLNRESVTARQQARGDSRDYARKVGEIRRKVGLENPELDVHSREFQRLVSTELAKGQSA